MASGMPGESGGAAALATKRIWDLPTRLMKWTLAGVVAANWFIGENLSFTNIETHFLLGYIAGGVLVLRLLWGFVGAKASRHAEILSAATRIFGYLGGIFRRAPSYEPGHTPTGALWTVVFWLLLAGQVITGLFSYSDSYFASGPLAEMVDESTRLQAVSLHHLFGAFLLLMVVLHIAAVIFYAVWKRENLVRPMITGRRAMPRSETERDNA